MEIFVAALVGAAALSLGLVRLLRARIRLPGTFHQVTVFGVYSPVLTWVNMTQARSFQKRGFATIRAALQGRLGDGLELLAIGLWALWIGRNLLNFDPHLWPVGREFGFDIYAFHFWEQLRECGLCSLWNGMLNGGFPSLGDPFTGHLHPLAAVATLLAGVVNGAKITVVASLFLAGVGQWWIGKLIGLGRWSRLWTALVATSGAHLAGQVELGSVADPMSAAAAILALAAALDLALNRSRKATLRFAALLALAVLAGHGYSQIALLAWAPWILLLTLTPQNRSHTVWREFVLAVVLAVLLAGIFLVPFVHFWPQAAKHTDPTFEGSQPLEYMPLNLVVHDWEFFTSTVLGKTPYPYLYTLYVGWPAIILAVVGLAHGKNKDRRVLLSLALGALTIMWLASGVPFRWVVGIFPGLAGVRHVALIAGLAIPALLALSGYGLDLVLQHPWPRIRLGLGLGETRTAMSISPAWILVIPLVASLRTADQFDQNFMVTDDKAGAYEAIEVLETPGLEWVSVPFGEHYWVEPGLELGLKMTRIAIPWWWEGREAPLPLLEATRELRDAGVAVCCSLNDVPVYHYPANEYATIETGSGFLPCTAHGSGADIRVTCDSGGGRLLVRENSWTGWSAEVNGKKAALEQGQWLSVRVPAGPVEARFRYLPLDVLVGALLTLTGIVLALALWIRAVRFSGAPPAA